MNLRRGVTETGSGGDPFVSAVSTIGADRCVVRVEVR